MSDSTTVTNEGGVPAWVLSGAAVAVVMGALWWGTREPKPEPVAAPDPSAQTKPGAETGQMPKTSEARSQGGGQVQPAPAVTADRTAAQETLAQAIELEKTGDLDNALALARHASSGGAGTRAYLLEGKILILQKQYEAAQVPLQRILQVEPNNPDAHYNLGLTWQQGRARDYNKARNAYLATLQAAPRYAAARFNLAVLCLEHGVMDEAGHHVATFRKDYPQDGRGVTLEQMFERARAAVAEHGAASGVAAPVGGK